MKNAMKKECKLTVRAVNEKVSDLDRKVVSVHEENILNNENMMLVLKKIDNKFNKMARKLVSEDSIFEEEEKIFKQESQLARQKSLNPSNSFQSS